MTTAGALAHLVFGVLLNGLLARAVSSILTRVADRREDDADEGRAGGGLERLLTRAVAVLVIAAGLVVGVVTVAGAAGALDRPAVVLALMAVVTLPLERARRGTRPASGLWAALEAPRALWIAGALLLAAWIPLLTERLSLPPVAWDALTYHLRFPLLWRQTGALVTAQAPVGDAGHVFYPVAGEMLLYWQLLSTGTDLFSALSQIPFALAGAAGVAALAIRCGAAPLASIAAGLVWLGTPTLLRQSVEPMVDVEMAAYFVALLLFAIRWRDRRERAALVLAAASLGLLVGTKYSGVAYAIAAAPVLVWSARTGPRSDRRTEVDTWIAAAAIVLLLGGFAYARNWIFGGNPLLPLQLRVGSTVLLPGPISLERYLGSDRPRLGWQELLLSARSVLEMGPGFLLLWIVPVVALFRSARTAPGGAARALALTGIAAFALASAVLPFREHRYFLPATAVAWTLAASTSGAGASAALRWSRLALLVLAIHLPLTLFYWLKDRFVAGPIGGEAAALLVFAIAGLCMLRPKPVRRAGRVAADALRPGPSRIRRLAALLVVLAVLLAGLAAALSRYEKQRFVRWTRYWSTRHEWKRLASARSDYAEIARSWSAVAEATRGREAIVAYAGMNIPYPLAGYGLRNRVLFASRNATVRAAELRWGSAPPDPFSLPDRTAWIANLEQLGVDYLCVYRQFPEIDPQLRFPVEEEWAAADPGRFEPVWSSRWARLYRLRGAGSSVPR